MLLLLATAQAQGLLGEDDVVGAAICAQTNAVRQANGRPALTVSDRLSHAAHLHAAQMVEHDFFGHTAPPRAALSRPVDRLLAAGVVSPHTPAENIATWFAMNYQPGDGYRVIDVETFSYRSRGRALQPHTPEGLAQALVDYWMESQGHRENILSRVPDAMGCAATMYLQDRFPMYKAVQLFL